MQKQIQQTHHLPKVKEMTRFGFPHQCWTPEPEFLATHCSFSDCSAWPLNTQGGEGSTWNGIWLHSNQSTHSSPASTKRTGRLEPLHWGRQLGKCIHWLPASFLSSGLTSLTHQLLYLKGALGWWGQEGSKRTYLSGSFSFIKNNNQKREKKTDLIIVVLELFLIGEIMELNTDSKKCWDAGHRWL